MKHICNSFHACLLFPSSILLKISNIIITLRHKIKHICYSRPGQTSGREFYLCTEVHFESPWFSFAFSRLNWFWTEGRWRFRHKYMEQQWHLLAKWFPTNLWEVSASSCMLTSAVCIRKQHRYWDLLKKQEPWYLHTALRRVGLGLFGFQALGNGKQIGEKESVNHSQLLALC